MAEKKTYINLTLPTATAAFAHLYAPDNKVPEGVTSWKPDGKNKITSVYDNEVELVTIRKTVLDALKTAYPHVNPDDFKLPIKEVAADDRKEDLRGKFLVIAATKAEKWAAAMADRSGRAVLVDSRGNRLPPTVLIKSGDKVRVKITANLYSKTEKVKVNGKIVDETVYGANFWLNAVQLIEKRSGGDDGWGDAVEGGYVNPSEDQGDDRHDGDPGPQGPQDGPDGGGDY